MAVISKHIGLATHLLLAHGANANQATHEGRTPLHYAAATGDPHMISLLRKHGASPYLTDMAGRLPLHYAVVSDMAEAVAMLAGENGEGASVNESALDLACTGAMRGIGETQLLEGGDSASGE